jgi:hypothetical protein
MDPDLLRRAFRPLLAELLHPLIRIAACLEVLADCASLKAVADAHTKD